MKNKRSKFKSCTAFLLALVMVVTLIPGNIVSAADDATEMTQPGYDNALIDTDPMNTTEEDPSTLTPDPAEPDENADPAEPDKNTDPVTPPTEGDLPTDKDDGSDDTKDPDKDIDIPDVDENPALDPEELEPEALAFAVPFALGDVTVDNVADLQAAVSGATSDITVTLSDTFPTGIDKTINLTNTNGAKITIDGNYNGAHKELTAVSKMRLFTIKATGGSKITLKNLVLNGNNKIGHTSLSAGSSGNENCVSFENCAFINGYGSRGVAISGAAFVELNINNCSFIDNTCIDSGWAGGTISFEQNSNCSDITITNSYFKKNVFTVGGTIHGGFGAAIGMYKSFQSSLTVDHCVFDENACWGRDERSDGAAIAFKNNGTNSTYSGNANLTVSNSTFYMNQTEDDGGAIMQEGGKLIGNIYNCTFVKNSGSDADTYGYGGAIQAYSGKCYVYYNTFYGNYFRATPSKGAQGGAIQYGILANNLFVDNSAPYLENSNPYYQNVMCSSLSIRGGNIGIDNGTKTDITSAVEFGTTTPILEDLYDSTISNVVGYQDDEDYSTAVTTLRVAPEAEADNAAITVPSDAKTDAVADKKLTFDQNGRARGDRLTAGAVEVNWVKYDANGGSWEGTSTVAGLEGYSKDGTTYYHETNNKDAYYTVHADITDTTVSVISDRPTEPDSEHSFMYWNTEADGSGTTYNADDLLNESKDLESLTLYAIWKGLFNVTYDANYTVDKPDDHLDPGHPIGDYEVLSNMFPRSGEHTFTGWNTRDDGTGTSYGAGSPLNLEGHTTLYAQWDTAYILTYNANYGTGKDVLFYGSEHKILGQQHFTRTNYVFDSWNTEKNGSGTSYQEGNSITIDANTTLYAQWYKNNVVVVYYENWPDGTNDSHEYVNNISKDDYTVLSPETVTGFKSPEGYIFIGWYNSQKIYPSMPSWWSSPGKVLSPLGLSKKSYYAQWTTEIANITFNANGADAFVAKFTDGTKEWKVQVGSGGPILQPVVDALPAFSLYEDYVFDGNWYEDAECTDKWEFSTDIARDELVLYAGWVPKYIVTFNANGGAFDDSANPDKQEIILSHGSLITDENLGALPTLTYADHSFGGWYTDAACTVPWNFDTVVEKDIELFAKWTANTIYYDVTYDGNGATSGVPVSTTEAAGSIFKIGGEPSRSGYTFVGWKSSADGETYDAGDEYTMPNSKVLFTALWSKNGGGGSTKYKVTYDANGGKGEYKTSGMSSGTSHTILTVGKTGITNSGYRFIGWSKTPTGDVAYDPGDKIKVNNNIRLYAQWEDINLDDTYTVVYSPNGGDGDKYNIIVEVDDTHTVLSVSNAALEYTNAGYVFRGWSTDPSATTPTYFGTGAEIIGDDAEEGDVITLYAIWAKLPEIPASAIPLGDLDYENHFAYIIGYPDGSVQPNGDITRAEIATIFLRLLTQDSRAELWKKTNDFSDVAPGSWYNNAVSTLANGNILKGYPDGTFLPDGSITRAELAAIAARFATVEDIKNMAGNATFTDITGHWAEDSIILAGAVGFLPEYSDGPFKPDQPITRAEVATMLNHVLKRHVNSEDDLQPGYKAWPDNLSGAAYYFDILEATNSHSYEASPDGIGEVWTQLIASPNWALLGGPDAESRDLVY